MMHRLPMLLMLMVCAAGTAVFAAETYPTKPIRMVVPFPPGAASDFLARTLGQKLNEQYGQPAMPEGAREGVLRGLSCG